MVHLSPAKSANIKPKNKRRKNPLSREEQFQEEKTERYNKLLNISTKQLHREAKVVKSFECQKIVRDIKELKKLNSAEHGIDSNVFDEGDTSKPTETSKLSSAKSSKKIETLEQKLASFKHFDLNQLVQKGLKRLGILNLNPHRNDDYSVTTARDMNGESLAQNQQNTEAGEGNILSGDSSRQINQSVVENMLRHKRLSTAMDELNLKVTEYRRWVMRREEVIRGDIPDFLKDNTGSSSGRKRRKHHHNKPNSMNQEGNYARSNKQEHNSGSGLFIHSLSGASIADFGDVMKDHQSLDRGGHEGNDSNYYGYHEAEVKRNRPGQRARKAKAMAIEARKAGKTWHSSVNWRQKKVNEASALKKERTTRKMSIQGKDRSGRNGEQALSEKAAGKDAYLTPVEAVKIAVMGKTWKEEGNTHPSWAAKSAAQRSNGITEFKGTRIKFD